MRAASSLLGIIAVLIGLMTGPFFHIHSESDGSHGQNDAAELHSHIFDTPADHHSANSHELEISGDHDRHHGAGVSVLSANARKIQIFVAEFESTMKIDEPSSIAGFGTEIPVRAHDPPAIRNSNPRSPPV
jgi:hypothetical protein